MVIDIANFNFDGGSGGGGKPALLQEKTATIVQNGSQTITPDEGFDGMSSVQINAAITGDSSAIDFSQIGYSDEFSSELNAKMNDDVAYSKTLYDAWNPSNTSAYELYSDNTKLVYAPNINTSNVTNMSYMFARCTSLKIVPMYNTSNVNDMAYMFSYCLSLKNVPLFDTSKVTNMSNMFQNCTGLTSVPSFDTRNVENVSGMFWNCTNLKTVPLFDISKLTSIEYLFNGCSGLTSVPSFDTRNIKSMYNTFRYCKSLTTIPYFDTSNVNSFDGIFYDCDSLTTIEGISFKSFTASTMSNYYLCGFGNSSIRKAVFKDIGYQSTAVQFNASYITNWGVNTDEIPDARQSLIDSLITYSFDRASAGYPTCTINLSSTTKSLLTSDEIAQIEAKGFTIA